MASGVDEILESFESLPNEAKREVASEILRRIAKFDNPQLTDDELTAIADDLFTDLDRRESRHE